ncbi:MAG: FG-GAP repeat protein [Terriglobales bacterium]
MTLARFAYWLRWGMLLTFLALLAALPAPIAHSLPAPSHPTMDAQPVEQGRQALPPGLAPTLAAALTADANSDDQVRPLPGRDDAFQATNPDQRLTTTFLPAGLTLATGDPASGVTWGMRLAALGDESHLLPVGEVAPLKVGGRLEYRRAGVTEWYLNSPLGLEQGFTLLAPPADQRTGALALVVDVTGAVVSAAGGEITLVLPDGERLRYGNLAVRDATGRAVPARLVGEGEQIRIVVEDGGAIYPLVVDPLVQVARLTANDGAAGDEFGVSVALSGDGNTALVGANNKKIGTNYSQGAAYVFTRGGGAWSQQQELTANDGAANDQFGNAVALSGDGGIAIVGALSKTIGTNGYQGAAYVYTRSGTTWGPPTLLTANDGAAYNRFGNAVALSGDGSTALVGASAKAIGGNAFQGAAYVFTRGGMTWSQQQELTAGDGVAYDSFGRSVALSGDGTTALVGAYGKTIGANTNQGAAYVFTRSGTTWSQQQELTANDGAANDRFGRSVALSGDGSTALVGAYYKTIYTRFGANVGQGAAYVFTRSGTTWSPQQELKADDGAANDRFGNAVALSVDGSTALVGARSKTIGANSYHGAAYVFTRSGTTWSQQQELTASDGAAGDYFGYAVALSGGGSAALVGAYFKTIGANTNQGAAYVYLQASPNPLPPPQPTAPVVVNTPVPLPVAHPTGVPITNPTPLPLPPRRP